VHSHRLVEALAAYRPDLYGAWLDEADAASRSSLLSAALRPHRIRTVQLTIRDCCGGAKGVPWEDLVFAAGDANADERVRHPRNRFRARYRGNCYVTCADIGFRGLTPDPCEAPQERSEGLSPLSEPGAGGR